MQRRSREILEGIELFDIEGTKYAQQLGTVSLELWKQSQDEPGCLAHVEGGRSEVASV